MADGQDPWEQMERKLFGIPEGAGKADDASGNAAAPRALPELPELEAEAAPAPPAGDGMASPASVGSPLAASPLELLRSGVPAGFGCILGTMVLFGLLGLPGSLGAAVGGYFGGRLAGDPARALTAAMLPFLLVAAIAGLASAGGLPPGAGPQDLGAALGEWLDYSPDGEALGPLSQLPDSGSAVFITVVVFAFVGGLSEAARRD
ncbi:MAG: hypothetical protein BEU05_02945 [Marine Group III euryarchaeote CG-Bathy2]|uniref:Uncharacterized protein n=2 Tax=Methanobacteriati TaxID=3366610 RepID=A0A075GXE5_9EURY|nr:hypothetical protein [uncultured marine group II/III euryarchaeote KM3_205_C10]OIR12603.1 MAG: hypothetical protein BEU05_02945 [Marine Group III euryarchaeote CG-Bathy2]